MADFDLSDRDRDVFRSLSDAGKEEWLRLDAAAKIMRDLNTRSQDATREKDRDEAIHDITEKRGVAAFNFNPPGVSNAMTPKGVSQEAERRVDRQHLQNAKVVEDAVELCRAHIVRLDQARQAEQGRSGSDRPADRFNLHAVQQAAAEIAEARAEPQLFMPHVLRDRNAATYAGTLTIAPPEVSQDAPSFSGYSLDTPDDGHGR